MLSVDVPSANVRTKLRDSSGFQPELPRQRLAQVGNLSYATVNQRGFLHRFAMKIVFGMQASCSRSERQLWFDP